MGKAFWHKLLPCVGVVLLAVIVGRVGPGNIVRAFGGLRPWPLLALPVLMFAMLAVQTLKWRLLLRGADVRVGFWTLLRLNLLGIFYGTITPGRVGTLLKVRYLAEHCGRPVDELSSSVVLDKLIELIVLGGFATGAAVMVAEHLGARALFFVVAVTLAFAGAGFVFYHRPTAQFVLGRLMFAVVPRSRHEGLRDRVDRVYAGMPAAMPLALAVGLSLVSWVLIWTQTYTIAVALSMDIPYGLFIVLIPIGSLASLIPVSVSGIGTRELALVPLLAAFGVAPEKTVTMSLLALLLCVFVPAILGATQTRHFARAAGSNPAAE